MSQWCLVISGSELFHTPYIVHSAWQNLLCIEILSDLIIVSHDAIFRDQLFSLKSISWKIYKYACLRWCLHAFVTLKVQNFNFNYDVKPESFDAVFFYLKKKFTQGKKSLKSEIQILHLAAFDASSWVLGQIWDILWFWSPKRFIFSTKDRYGMH